MARSAASALGPRSNGERHREVDLANRLDDLHEMLYTRGGIKPANTAIEELSKLLLLRVWLGRRPGAMVEGHGPLIDVLDPDVVRAGTSVEPVKAAFRQAIADPDLAAQVPDGSTQPVWPIDEPLRITRSDVLARALEVLAIAIGSGRDGAGDVLGTAFDMFLRGRYDHAGGLSTYLTPTPVTSAAAEIALSLVDPWSFEGLSFGDPCSGTGRFLVGMLDRLRNVYGDTAQGRAQFQRVLDHGVFGADQSSASIAKATVNLLLYGAHHPQMFTVEDSITDPALDKMRGSLSLILTNPPFGDGKYDSVEGIRRTATWLPPLKPKGKIDPALAFVGRCVDLLRPGGVVGIVLPDGLVDGPVLRTMLLNSGTTEAPDLSVEASISLPTATFALSGTVARTSLLFLRRGRASSTRVFLARSQHVGYLKQGKRAVPDPAGNDLPVIARAARKALATNSAKHVKTVVSQDPLIASIPRLDVLTLDPASWDPASLGAKEALATEGADQLELFLTLSKTRASPTVRRGVSAFVSVLHVDDLGCVRWHEAETYAPLTPGQIALAGQLVISLLNPSKLRAFVVPDRYASIECSAEFGVFDVRRADAYLVLALLHDPRVRAQLAPLGRGTSSSRRRIDPVDVFGLSVPRLSKRRQAALALRTRSNILAVQTAQLALADAYVKMR